MVSATCYPPGSKSQLCIPTDQRYSYKIILPRHRVLECRQRGWALVLQVIEGQERCQATTDSNKRTSLSACLNLSQAQEEQRSVCREGTCKEQWNYATELVRAESGLNPTKEVLADVGSPKRHREAAILSRVWGRGLQFTEAGRSKG